MPLIYGFPYFFSCYRPRPSNFPLLNFLLFIKITIVRGIIMLYDIQIISHINTFIIKMQLGTFLFDFLLPNHKYDAIHHFLKRVIYFLFGLIVYLKPYFATSKSPRFTLLLFFSKTLNFDPKTRYRWPNRKSNFSASCI